MPEPMEFKVSQGCCLKIKEQRRDGGGAQCCIGYFAVAVIRHHDQGNLWKGKVMLAYSSKGIRVHHGRERRRP